MNFVESLAWRYATKKFDASKKVAQDDIDYIKEAVRLSASSYGLQPYKVLEIKDDELRKKLQPLSWNQSQITDASHLFVFCNFTEVNDQNVDELMHLKAQAYEVPLDSISGYGEFVKGKLHEKTSVEMFHWTAKQAYIALANAMDACAERKIDCTPMEGFESEAINEQLNLPKKGLNACVMLAVGYRHAEDKAQENKKVRKNMDKLFDTM